MVLSSLCYNETSRQKYFFYIQYLLCGCISCKLILARNSLSLLNYIQVGLYCCCMGTLKHTQVFSNQNSILNDCCDVPLSIALCSMLLCPHPLQASIALKNFNADQLQWESKVATGQAFQFQWRDARNSVPILRDVCVAVCNAHVSGLLCACFNFPFS